MREPWWSLLTLGLSLVLGLLAYVGGRWSGRRRRDPLPWVLTRRQREWEERQRWTI